MAWRIEFERSALREFEKLSRPERARILAFLTERLAVRTDPRQLGQPLKGATLGEFWRYRVGNYRVLVRLKDRELVILVIRVGHRREVYR
jgi:mRNA interferase RelE/StbE